MKIRKSHVAGCIATLMLPCCAYARSEKRLSEYVNPSFRFLENTICFENR